MVIEAIFELWLVGDGSYPHLAVGMHVSLSFEMALLQLGNDDNDSQLISIRDTEYSFAGTVIARYEEPEPLVVIEAGNFRFFSEGQLMTDLRLGDKVSGEGVLVVDYYAWAEYVDVRPAAPDIFSTFAVRRIRRAQIPAHLVHVAGSRKSYPTRVRIADCSDISEVKTTAAINDDSAFYVLDLETIDQMVPRTFISK